jgi:hypothetical protein
LQCRFEGREMVLTQVTEEGAENEGCARDLLKAEYKLLCKGDSIKVHFDKWAAEHEVSVPSKQYIGVSSSMYLY